MNGYSVTAADIIFNDQYLPLVLTSGTGKEIIKPNEALPFYVTSDKTFALAGVLHGSIKKEESGSNVALSLIKKAVNNCRLVVTVVGPAGQQYAPFTKIDDKFCIFIMEDLLRKSVIP